jgi:hypothetical protein
MSRDIVCPKCCEPCEIDTLHEYVSEVVDLMPAASASVSFASVYQTFITDGCGAALHLWEWGCEPVTDGGRAIVAELAYLMGDDVDGFAAMCDDFDVLGGW